MAQLLEIEKIRLDGGTQSRVALNESVVAEYAEAILAGASMPPVTVYFDGSDYWLADGFHRLHAHRKADRPVISVDARTGTQREAILHSLGANGDHGLRRSNADKRRAVETLLADSEWGAWTDRQMAKVTGVSVPFVGSMRRPEVKERQQANRDISNSRKAQRCNPITPAPTRSAPEPPPDAEPTQGKRAAAPTIESLQAENETLRAELAEARHMAGELAEDLDALQKSGQGELEVAKEFKRLNGVIRSLEAVRDSYMTKSNELIRQNSSLQRKLAKVAA